MVQVKAFYEQLLRRGKQPRVALVAVMRKLLHAIYGMLKHGQNFKGQSSTGRRKKSPLRLDFQESI